MNEISAKCRLTKSHMLKPKHTHAKTQTHSHTQNTHTHTNTKTCVYMLTSMKLINKSFEIKHPINSVIFVMV